MTSVHLKSTEVSSVYAHQKGWKQGLEVAIKNKLNVIGSPDERKWTRTIDPHDVNVVL